MYVFSPQDGKAYGASSGESDSGDVTSKSTVRDQLHYERQQQQREQQQQQEQQHQICRRLHVSKAAEDLLTQGNSQDVACAAHGGKAGEDKEFDALTEQARQREEEDMELDAEMEAEEASAGALGDTGKGEDEASDLKKEAEEPLEELLKYDCLFPLASAQVPRLSILLRFLAL